MVIYARFSMEPQFPAWKDSEYSKIFKLVFKAERIWQEQKSMYKFKKPDSLSVKYTVFGLIWEVRCRFFPVGRNVKCCRRPEGGKQLPLDSCVEKFESLN